MFIYFVCALLIFFLIIGIIGFEYQSDPTLFYNKKGKLDEDMLLGCTLLLIIGSLAWPIIIMVIPAIIVFTMGKKIAKLLKEKKNV